MFNLTTDQTIALAGLYQSLALVQQVAWHGDDTHSCLIPTIESILKIDTNSYIDAYGSANNLSLGFRVLKETLKKHNDERVKERTHYAIKLMYLENTLARNSSAMSSLGGEIERIKLQNSSLEDSLPIFIQELSRLYREYISTLGPKIIIHGNPTYLKIDQNASLIRTLLLAGIRAIVLWRQGQGKRWSLLLGRNSILKNITAIEQNK